MVVSSALSLSLPEMRSWAAARRRMAHVCWVRNARWTIMMMLPRKPPSLAEKGRRENVEDLALLTAPGGRCARRGGGCKCYPARNN